MLVLLIEGRIRFWEGIGRGGIFDVEFEMFWWYSMMIFRKEFEV